MPGLFAGIAFGATFGATFGGGTFGGIFSEEPLCTRRFRPLVFFENIPENVLRTLFPT